MTLKDSVNRLSFTVSKSNKPNQTDMDALNTIIDTLNKNAKDTVQENRLFAKLYIIVLKDLALRYGSVDVASSLINRNILENSTEMLCKKLCEALNRIELKRICNSKEKPTDAEILSSLETWDLDSVIANMNISVSQAVNHYKNLP